MRIACMLLLLSLACAPAAAQESKPVEAKPEAKATPEAKKAPEAKEAPEAKKAQEAKPEAKKTPEDETLVYRTPLAGKPFKTNVFGTDVDLKKRDRRTQIALTLGTSYFFPKIGDQSVIPFLALYYKRWSRERRARAVISGLVNDIEYAEFVGPWDVLLRFENSTIPFATTEIVDGQDLDFSAMEHGYNSVWLGFGYRLKAWPGNVDNEVLIQAYYQSQYDYFKRDDDTHPSLVTPTDTYMHGFRFRLRLDMIQRNIIELAHWGVAAGTEIGFTRRDRWQDTGPIKANGERLFLERDTRDYWYAQAYLVFASPVPFLSERHRLIGQIYGAWAPNKSLDRYSAFRIGGGPQPTEASDLGRSPYPAAIFDQFLFLYGLVATLEYRFEILFFLYLSLRGTVAWGKIPTYDGTAGPPGAPRFERRRGEAFSAAITSGFLWDSLLQIEYAYDSGTVRAGDRGHALLVTWSISF